MEVKVLKRIQGITNVGNYLKTNAGNIVFEHVTVVYGENRNGKSTLCDILRSLSLNDPRLIINRESIVLNKKTNELSQKVEISFDEQKELVKFESKEWQSLPPESSKLYVFDHSFIHRNVMTGNTYTRENSENISGFILGENAQRFEELELKNKELRDHRKELSNIEIQLRNHSINNIEDFIASPLPNYTIEDIDSEIAAIENSLKNLSIQASNTTQIIGRSQLESISNHKDIKEDLDNINDCLSSSIQSVHDASKAIVKAHKQYVEEPQSFDGWAVKGIQHLKEDCPFCGQELQHTALSLIESYRTAFDNSFQNFIAQTKSKITKLQKKTLISSTINDIHEHHKRNLMVLESYIEVEIKNELGDLVLRLINSLKSIEQLHLDLFNTYINYTKEINSLLDTKREIPYEPLSSIDFEMLINKVSDFNTSIDQYNLIKDEINKVLLRFKKSQDLQSIQDKEHTLSKNKAKLLRDKKRIELDSYCMNYSSLKDKLRKEKLSYDQTKTKLELEQEVFLDTYFDRINTLFRRIGSSNFEISRTINRGGTKTVYDIGVTFNGKEINRYKFNSLFSESDRRALALSIFLSKIELLPEVDRKKAILVMDDPVTSFDDERISNILQLLYQLKSRVKQIIITTHYKGMASSVIKQFKDVKVIKIVHKADGSHLEPATKSEMKATAHDKAYSEIMDFIEFKTQDNKIKLLRPFLEAEVKSRYRHHFKMLKLNDSNSFGEHIKALKDNEIITPEIATSLEGYKDSLNIPSHELLLHSIDNCRAQAKDLMDFIYSEL